MGVNGGFLGEFLVSFEVHSLPSGFIVAHAPAPALVGEIGGGFLVGLTSPVIFDLNSNPRRAWFSKGGLHVIG